MDHVTGDLGRLSSLIRQAGGAVFSTRRSYLWQGATATLLRESFLEAASLLRVEVLLELGAHAAEASREFVTRTGGIAVAFEANPETYALHTRRAERFGVDTRNQAVGSSAGSTEMYVPVVDGRGRVLAAASFLPRTNPMWTETLTVEVIRVDDVAVEFEGKSIALWIDCEGIALEVLQGSSELLDSGRCVLIQLEVETESVWRKQHLDYQVDEYLRSRGYVAVMRDAEYEPVQYNVIYVRQRDLPILRSTIDSYWSELVSLRVSRTSWLYKAVKRRAEAPFLHFRRKPQIQSHAYHRTSNV